jgi:proteasome lid subunit RPN8/RPN11
MAKNTSRPVKIVLSVEALEALISSATRGYDARYKKEVGGHLLGFFRRGGLYVSAAMHYRARNAKRTWLEVSLANFRRKGRRLAALTGLHWVGEYHSHNDGSTMLSGDDRKVFRNFSVPAMLVIRVSDTHLPRHEACFHYSDGTSGYHYDISGYISDSDGRPMPLDVTVGRGAALSAPKSGSVYSDPVGMRALYSNRLKISRTGRRC